MGESELRPSRQPRRPAVILLVGIAVLILGGWGILSYLRSLDVGYVTRWHVPGSLYYQGVHYLLEDTSRCPTFAAEKKSRSPYLGWPLRRDGTWRGLARFVPAGQRGYASAVFLQPRGHSCVMLYISRTTFF